MSSVSRPTPKPVDPLPDAKPASDAKNLVPILVIVGVLMCGCLGLPVLGGAAMLLYWASDRPEPAPPMMAGPGQGLAPDFGAQDFARPQDFSAFGGSASKADLENALRTAETQLASAQAQYEGAQAAYEQQRNFNLQQGGRLGTQGISPPPAIPPDPQLQFNVQAAQAQYDQAKAAYDAAQ